MSDPSDVAPVQASPAEGGPVEGHLFDEGYPDEPFRSLVAGYPGEDVYPSTAFRTEWGPIFHRGRLDGSARILVLGQDPATHESVVRRILVGAAGQRIQGLLTRLGIDRSYVFLNTFLYSVYGQGGGERHVHDAAITTYRNRWIEALAQTADIQAVLSLGHLADTAYHAVPAGVLPAHAYVTVLHPTYPESASQHGDIRKAEAMKRLCASWNSALDALSPHLSPDTARPLVHYGDALTPADLTPIPERDLPPGLPAWMRGLQEWARRTGADPATKRATLTVTVPPSAILGRADRLTS